MAASSVQRKWKMVRTSDESRHARQEERPQFDYRAVAVGAAVSPISFWLLHGIAKINAFVGAGSVLTVVAVAFASVLLWGRNAQGRNAERRQKISLAFDSFVNAVFGHGIAFVLIRFLYQVIQRFI